MTAPPFDQQWFSPAQAALHLGCPHEKLIRLVADGHLPVHRLPDGALVISAVDLAALRTPVLASEAVGLLTNLFNKESTMQDVARVPTAMSAELPTATISVQAIFNKIEELIEETHAKLERQPMWLDFGGIKRAFGIDERRLHDYVSNGFVRKAKLGETLQAKALYCTADVHDVLSRLAVGKPPRSALRKVGVNDAA